MAGPWTLLRLLRQTDFLPHCTQSRLFLADLLPPKAEGCHHFSPKREKDAVFTATGGTIWPLLEQGKLSMSQAPAPCIAPPSTSSCLHTAEKHVLILLFHCPTVFSLMLTVHLLHVYAYDRGTIVTKAGKKNLLFGIQRLRGASKRVLPLWGAVRGQGMDTHRWPGLNVPQSIYMWLI